MAAGRPARRWLRRRRRAHSLAGHLLAWQLILAALGPAPASSLPMELLADEPPPSAHLSRLGLVRGLRFERAPGEQVAAFLGLAYAGPPSGSLRFMPPSAARPPSGPQSRNDPCKAQPLISFGPRCVRLADWRNLSSRHQDQAEDCLRLNVFVPLEGRSVRRRPEAARGPDRAESNYPSQAQVPSRQVAAAADDDASKRQDNRTNHSDSITAQGESGGFGDPRGRKWLNLRPSNNLRPYRGRKSADPNDAGPWAGTKPAS